MMLDDLIQQPQYSVPQAEKEAVLLAELTRLGQSHRERSPEYARLARVLFPGSADPHNLAELPYIPVALFKEHLLSSVPASEIFKILQSRLICGEEHERVAEKPRGIAAILQNSLGSRNGRIGRIFAVGIVNAEYNEPGVKVIRYILA